MGEGVPTSQAIGASKWTTIQGRSVTDSRSSKHHLYTQQPMTTILPIMMLGPQVRAKQPTRTESDIDEHLGIQR